MPFLREKSGRWSPEKIVAFVGACLPALWLAWRVWTDDLNPARPVNEAIHFVGFWTILFLVMSLAVSPARRLFGAPRLVNMRRTLGVTAFCYAALHLTLYALDQKFDFAKVASEIVLRIYLTIGFVALLGLAALTATSTDAMIRRLGPRWNTLHNIVYATAILGIIHYMMQTKLDITQSVMVAGFLFWLLGYRLMHRYIGSVTHVWQIVLTLAAALLTAIAEAGWYGATTGVPAWRVFSVNFDYTMTMRPSHWVLAAGFGVTLASVLWSRVSQRLSPRKEPRARRTASRAAVGAVQVQSGS